MVDRIRGTLSCRTIAILSAGLIGLCALTGETVENDRPGSTQRSDLRNSTAKQGSRRVREGSKLEDELGEFREAGERIHFYLNSNKTRFIALENLALDRVSKVLDDNTTPRTWSVTGVVTEYQSGSFLLVTRATLKPNLNRILAERF
jgi:hypothetical protein